MKRVLFCGLLLALATGALVACDDKKKDATPATGSASAAVTASAAPSAAPSASAAAVASAAPAAGESDEDVADEEDFGEEVSKSIDDKNFESELDKLEKEIGK